MAQNNFSKNVFIEIGFRSSEEGGGIETIELLGVPGKRTNDGQYTVDRKVQLFFDDLIVKKLFYDSRKLLNCNFEHLKIWLYDTDTKDEERGYKIPKIDKNDLSIRSDTKSSKLERIYVLDNELTEREYRAWEENCIELFTPLFTRFLAPPEPPEILKSMPFMKLAGEVAEKFDPYLSMKQNVFFNALIIQID